MLSDPAPSRAESERLLVLIGYGLLLIAPAAGGVAALAGVVVAYVRRPHAAGLAAESHYSNQIRVFWTILVYVLAVVAMLAMGLGFSFASLAWPAALGWPFWQVALAGHVAAWALLLPVLGLVSLGLGVWYYWRLLRGFVRMLDDKPY